MEASAPRSLETTSRHLSLRAPKLTPARHARWLAELPSNWGTCAGCGSARRLGCDACASWISSPLSLLMSQLDADAPMPRC